MALIERLMHVTSDDPRNISVHSFFAAAQEIIGGRLTSSGVQTYLDMDASDIVDWNAIVATMPSAAKTAERAVWISGIHAALILAEVRATGYATPAQVRTKLGI
jgi:hypothetical protein